MTADDLILRSSMGDILSEICSYDKPIYFVITKCDKISSEIISDNVENLKKNLKKYIGEKSVKIAYTSVRDNNIDEALKIFKEVQSKSKSIITDKYIRKFNSISDITVKFLNELIKNSELTESELAEKEEKMIEEIKRTNEGVLKLNENFDSNIEKCINDIQNDVRTALNSNESSLVTMALNGSNISEKLNSIVRSAVTESVQRRFVPLVEKYINKTTEITNINVSGEISDNSSNSVSADTLNLGDIVSIGLLIGEMLGPIAMLVVSVVGVILSIFVKGENEKKKKEEEKARIKRELNGNVFPNIMSQVGDKVRTEIMKKVSEVKESVNKNIETNRETMQKALNDVKKQREQESEEIKAKIDNAKKNLETIEKMKKMCRL